MSVSRPVRTLLAAVPLVLVLPACSGGGGAADADTVTVTATDTECTPSTSELDAGTQTFELKNTGSRGTELYVLREDGSTVGERENIGPGITIRLTVELTAGKYVLRCRPGDTGEGIKTALTVTGDAGATQADARITAATTAYRGYVAEQSADSLALAKQLRAAIAAGDLAKAKALYAPSRVGWERVEPVAESFGDLDPRVDAREADLEAGQTWTGWHVIEKGLWTTNSTAGLLPVADRLVTDLEELVATVPSAVITGTSMANGAKELLDEVATGKVTGEEEAFSHTDLVDFQANVDGARRVYDLLRPVVAEAQPDLATEIEAAFAALGTRLDALRTGTGPAAFPSYDTVGAATRQDLSAAVDALAEPLSHLAAAVAGATA